MSDRLNNLELREYAQEALMLRPPRKQINGRTNFIIKENNAYTEDNVLIYNIFVYNIPNHLSENDIRSYFSKFGELVDLKCIQNINILRCAVPKVAIVDFAEPESACSVLREKNHCLDGWSISVMAADSLNQPSVYKSCGPTRNEDDIPSTSKGASTATNGGMHLLLLNDDCIEAIFGYLELKEQVRFASVCERFRDIFQMLCKRKYKNFPLSNIRGMTLREIHDLFRFAGRNIASITGTFPYKNRDRIFVFISTYCGKLNRLRLDNCKMRNEYLKELVCGCPQLQELTLRNCSLNDNSIEIMAHLHRLETINLAENGALTGKFIGKLVQLKVLNLCGCYDIQTSNLLDICKSLPQLRSLDIRRSCRLTATVFDVMVDHYKELEILKMSSPEFPYERVALLPRLKHLELLSDFIELHIYDRAQNQLLAELVKHKADQLEVLKITALNTLSAEHIVLISELRQLKTLFIPYKALVNDYALTKFCELQQLEELTIKGCNNITNHGLLNLVKNCKHLRRLNIQFCKQITIEFLLETIRFLKASGKRKKPLVLVTCDTAMDYYEAITHEEYKEAKKESLVIVLFKPSWLVLALENGVDIGDIWDGERWYDEVDYPTEDDDEEVYFPKRETDDVDDGDVIGDVIW